MKKNFYYLGAIVASAVFAGCSSDDSFDDGKYDKERGVVKTEFTISYPVRVSQQTRMTAAMVQYQPSNFRGISDIKLYPFTANATTVASTASTALPTPIILTLQQAGKTGGGNASDAYTLDPSGVWYTNSNSHLYQDVEIPIGTQTFMFYGRAIPGSSSNAEKGQLNATGLTGSGTLNDISFALQPIAPTPSLANANTIATYLTNIANVSGWSTTDNVILSTLYANFITMKGGSWTSIKAALQWLYKSLHGKSFASATDQTLATNIMAAIAGTDALGPGNSVTASGADLTFPASFAGYPNDNGLPDGAAYINWDTDNFAVVTANTNLGLDISALDKYVYPAELWYRVISGIKVADRSMAAAYTDEKTWAQITATDGFADGSIQRTTRSVAITDPVQYAVGRFDINIKANGTQLEDNVGNLFDVSSTNAKQLIKMTGVLVGGQKPVNYLFQPTGDTEYTIYDNVMNNTSAYLYETQVDNANHTLVLESAAGTEENFAIEFEYSSTATAPIEATRGLIYPGTKFYLVGKLTPNASQKAFEQDKYTVATINVKSLKNAYNVMPDLRAPQLELGLSVDLTWIEGFSQTIDIE